MKLVTVFKFQFIHKFFGDTKFKLLDIGCGNNSAIKTKKQFPNSEYYGVDMVRDYNSKEENFKLMEAFYELDLSKLELSTIPNNHFDYIQLAHVIEHIENGDKVIEQLIPKLKKEGYIYIEYPGIKSTKLPSMHGTLNFYDDPTHVRIYSVKEIESLLQNNGFEIIKSGTRRNWIYIVTMPLRIIEGLWKYRKLNGNIFWDVLGFAEFCVAKKIG